MLAVGVTRERHKWTNRSQLNACVCGWVFVMRCHRTTLKGFVSTNRGTNLCKTQREFCAEFGQHNCIIIWIEIDICTTDYFLNNWVEIVGWYKNIMIVSTTALRGKNHPHITVKIKQCRYLLACRCWCLIIIMKMTFRINIHVIGK